MIQARYRLLYKIALQSVGLGIVSMLVLHYTLPFAEHPRILSTIGLLLDAVGVVWVAYDVFPFEGVEEYGEEHAHRSGIETPEYKEFKREHVSKGLSLLVIGFFFQIFAYWMEEFTLLLP